MAKKEKIGKGMKECLFVGKAGQAIAVTALVGFSLLGPAAASDEQPAADEAVISDGGDGMIVPLWGEWVCGGYHDCLGKYTPCATGIKPCEIKYEYCKNITQGSE